LGLSSNQNSGQGLQEKTHKGVSEQGSNRRKRGRGGCWHQDDKHILSHSDGRSTDEEHISSKAGKAVNAVVRGHELQLLGTGRGSRV
jgi:hypothetical protein